MPKPVFDDATRCVDFPVTEIPVGEIMPPLTPAHPSWPLVRPDWDDPLMPFAGFNRSSSKQRIETEHGPAIELSGSEKYDWPRSLITGGEHWGDYHLRCRLACLEANTPPNQDHNGEQYGRAGLVFRVQNSRWYYQFCLEAQCRLMVYRRQDECWEVLAQKPVEYGGQPVTLTVALDGDQITAACPELGVQFEVRDDVYTAGKAGFRAIGRTHLYELQVQMTEAQQAKADLALQRINERVAAYESKLRQDRKTGEIPLEPQQRLVTSAPLAAVDSHQLLFSGAEGLCLRDWDQKTLWHFPEKVFKVEVAASREGRPGRIYTLVGQRASQERVAVRTQTERISVADQIVILDAATGRELQRTALPPDPDPHSRPHVLAVWDFAFEVGTAETDDAIDFLIKQDRGDGRHDVWAYDRCARLLWHHRVDTPYGHHNSIHHADVNHDGKREVLVGGTLLDTQGNRLWEHDQAEAFSKIRGGRHYDATIYQDPALGLIKNPIILLIGGSAGVYVVDAHTGRTLQRHEMGHAQWAMRCRMREDMPGEQFMVGTRWSNFGILSMFDDQGRRLWTLQPDYIVQNSLPVQWQPTGPQHFWVNTTRDAQGLYDGHGHFVHRLPRIRDTWGDRTARQVSSTTIRRQPTSTTDTLAITIDSTVHLFEGE